MLQVHPPTGIESSQRNRERFREPDGEREVVMSLRQK